MQASRNSSSKKSSQQILLTQYLTQSTAKPGGGGGGSSISNPVGSNGGSAQVTQNVNSIQVVSQVQQNQQQNQQQQQQQQQQQLSSSSSIRDIVNLRKQIVSHPWFISMEDTLNKQYIPQKSLRKPKQNLNLKNNQLNDGVHKINTESLMSGQFTSFPFELPLHTPGRQLTFLATASVSGSNNNNNSKGNIDGNQNNSFTNNNNGNNLTNPTTNAGLLNYMKTEKVLNSNIQSSLSNPGNTTANNQSNNQSDDPEQEFEKPEMKNFSYTYAYTQQDRKKEITIKLHDLKKLLPNQYLNDSIVNFFLKFFEVEMLTEQMQEKVLIFNTYFMSKLAPNEQIEAIYSGEPAAMQPLFEKNYQTVRRWIKEDIFEKDFLVFPLNLPEHWSVAIVCNHKRLLTDQQETLNKKKEQKEEKLDKKNVEEKKNQKDNDKISKQNTKEKEALIDVHDKEQESQKMEEEEQNKDSQKDNNKITGPTTTLGNSQIGKSSANQTLILEENNTNKDTTMEIEEKNLIGVVDSSKSLPGDKSVVISNEKVKGNKGAEVTEVNTIDEEEAEVTMIKKDSSSKAAVNPHKASLNEDEDSDEENDDDSYSAESDQTDNQNPCILYFDSFGLLDSKYSTMIRLYLQKEITHKLKQLSDNHNNNNNSGDKQEQTQKHIEVNEITLPSRQPLIPRQTNYVDCGLYLLEYVEDFLNSSPSQRSIFTSNSSDDWVQLNWFPRCNITSKRRFIKELILDLSVLPVTQAVQNYKQKRQVLMDENSEKAEEYDEVDMEEFEEHLEDIIHSEQDYPETDMERHRMLLDFYMNPQYNKYEVV